MSRDDNNSHLENQSTLHHLMYLFHKSAKSLNYSLDRIEVEKICITIHRVMNGRYRKYHTVEHIFNISKSLDPIGTLAAVFHDIVYIQVDKRIHPLISHLLSPFQFNEQLQCTIPDLTQDPILSKTAAIFGVVSGQKLGPFDGINEFLSAIVAAKVLGSFIDEWEVAQVIACIEATIPFRQPDTASKECFELLRERLEKFSNQSKLNEVDVAVKRAVSVANQDVSGFFSPNLGLFLSDTWDLILEGNPIFKDNLSSIKQYRIAVQKVSRFLESLSPEKVVHQFRNFPSVHEFQNMKSQVKNNLDNSVHYLKLILLAATILEAISELTGGDAPQLLLLGKYQNSDVQSRAPIESHLRVINPLNQSIEAYAGKNIFVRDVLRYGRSNNSDFDFNHSPIASFLYENLSRKQIDDLFELTLGLHNENINYEQYLLGVPEDALSQIMLGVAAVSWSRKDQIIMLMKKVFRARS